MTKCKCGKRMSKWASMCTSCHREKMNKTHAEARAIVATGKCPICGEKLKRNLSMAGWWQCAQLGAEIFRVRPLDPPCNFQTFTE